MRQKPRIKVAACESQPVTAEGLRYLINRSHDLEFVGAADSPQRFPRLLSEHPPDLVILDKSFGSQAVFDLLRELRAARPAIGAVVWGLSITEAETWRLRQAGAKGILRRSALPEALLACLRAVASGAASWMDPGLCPNPAGPARGSASLLTSRERQVLELVAHGLKNREIAAELGIRPGTVKVHLKHIFEKTGVRGRHALALADLEAREAPALIAP